MGQLRGPPPPAKTDQTQWHLRPDHPPIPHRAPGSRDLETCFLKATTPPFFLPATKARGLVNALFIYGSRKNMPPQGICVRFARMSTPGRRGWVCWCIPRAGGAHCSPRGHPTCPRRRGAGDKQPLFWEPRAPISFTRFNPKDLSST